MGLYLRTRTRKLAAFLLSQVGFMGASQECGGEGPWLSRCMLEVTGEVMKEGKKAQDAGPKTHPEPSTGSMQCTPSTGFLCGKIKPLSFLSKKDAPSPPHLSWEIRVHLFLTFPPGGGFRHSLLEAAFHVSQSLAENLNQRVFHCLLCAR